MVYQILLQPCIGEKRKKKKGRERLKAAERQRIYFFFSSEIKRRSVEIEALTELAAIWGLIKPAY